MVKVESFVHGTIKRNEIKIGNGERSKCIKYSFTHEWAQWISASNNEHVGLLVGSLLVF